MKKSLVSQKIKNLPFSGIRRFFDVANEMEDVISLGVGEPDFFTPENARKRAIFEIENHKTSYTSNSGLLELREEISKYLKESFDTFYKPESQILITVGASEGIDLALRAVLDEGDEVLLVEPAYVSYRSCIIMAGGIPVTVLTKSENNFKLQPEDLKGKITEKTKAIIFCYPNNPTGAVMDYDDLKKIVDLLKDKNILIISDEIYAELSYNKKHVSIASFKEVYEQTIVLNGFSKTYAMTGWRVGYACASEELIEQITKIHQYTIMCAPTVSQFTALEALKNSAESIRTMRAEYNKRRIFLLESFRSMGLPCFEALGAFYLFPSIEISNMNSEDFCMDLLDKERLALVPGTAFGDCGEGFVRCSYSYSLEELEKAIYRLDNYIKKFR